MFFNSILYSFILLFSVTLQAQFSGRQLHCTKNLKWCSQERLRQHVMGLKTPRFNHLIDQLNYQSEDYLTNFPSRLRLILQTEMLDPRQLRLLVSLVKSIPEHRKNAQHRRLQADLEEWANLIVESHSLIADSTDLPYVVFKTGITANMWLKQQHKLNPQIPVLYYHLKASRPEVTPIQKKSIEYPESPEKSDFIKEPVRYNRPE